MRLHCASFDAFIGVGTVGIYFIGSCRVSWPNSRATAICICTILWSLWQGYPVGRAKIFMKVDTRGRNATVSNTARVPLTPLTFNKIIRGGLFIWISCHFGINEICRSVSDHIGLLFEEVTTEWPCWRADMRDWNCFTNEFCCYIFETVLCYNSEGRWFDPSWCQWIFHWHKILLIALWPWGRLSL